KYSRDRRNVSPIRLASLYAGMTAENGEDMVRVGADRRRLQEAERELPVNLDDVLSCGINPAAVHPLGVKRHRHVTLSIHCDQATRPADTFDFFDGGLSCFFQRKSAIFHQCRHFVAYHGADE